MFICIYIYIFPRMLRNTHMEFSRNLRIILNMSQAEEPENNSTEESRRGESIRKNPRSDERRSQVLGRSPSELPDGRPPETLRSLENGKLDKQHVWKTYTLSTVGNTPQVIHITKYIRNCFSDVTDKERAKRR